MSFILSPELLAEHGIVSPGDNERAALYEAAVDRVGLLLADYMLIRDLRKYAECTGKEVDALLLCLFAALNSGSACLHTDSDSLRRSLERFLPETEVDAELEAINALLETGGMGPLLGTSEQDYTPLIRPGRDLLYFQKYHAAEHALQKTLDAIVDEDTSLTPMPVAGGAAAVSDIFNTVCDTDPVTVDGNPVHLVLHDAQNLVEIVAVDDAVPPHGREKCVALECPCATPDLELLLPDPLDRIDHRVEQDLDTLGAEVIEEGMCYVGLLLRQDLRRHLDEGDLCPRLVEHARELNAEDAASLNQNMAQDPIDGTDGV